jgi:uncharacterized protein YhaN
MRLNRLDLTRFGAFTDRSLTFPAPPPGQPDLHIVYGANEAGKSTLLAAWSDLMFGIPVQSPYGFLHPYAAMRIGAALDLDGAEVEVVRLKRAERSLLDGHDTPVPEAMLQGALGGLSRESYAAMFSLNDETLVRGGDSILASKGDLGEMLFSASAGMADLSRKLEALRAEADEFHKPGGRKGPVTEAKAALADLEQRRKDLDVQAGAWKDLLDAQTRAEAALAERQAEHASVATALAALRQKLAVWPLRNRLAQLRDALQPLSDLQHLPDGWGERLAQSRDARTAAEAQRDEAQRALAKADRELAELAPDPAVLALADQITAAEAQRSAHDEAVKDLPNRRAEAEEQAGVVARSLQALGRAGADPAGLILDRVRVAGLRDLIAARSGLQTRLDTAAEEARAATRRCDGLAARLAEANAAGDSAALAELLKRLRQRDPIEALARATRAEARAAAALTDRMAALAPWSGPVGVLAALAVPGPAQIDTWTRRAETLRIAAQDSARAVDAAAQALGRATAQARARAEGTGVNLADAAAARADRERLWADHVRALTPASAAAFEAALRRDDQIAALLVDLRADARLALAHQAELATLAEDVLRAETARTQAQTDLAAHRADVQTALAGLGLAHLTLADLPAWLQGRGAALAAGTALAEAEGDTAAARQALDQAAATLRQALGADTALPFDTLWAEAEARIAADHALATLRQTLAEARAEDVQRRDALAAATAADQSWRAAWQGLVVGTWLDSLDADVARVGAALGELDTLAKAVLLKDGLTDRIAKMEANRDRFVHARQSILSALDLPESTPWHEVQNRLRLSRTAFDAQERAADDQTTARGRLADIADALAASERTQADMAAALHTPVAALADVVAACQTADRLRAEITETLRQLSDAGGSDDADPLPDRALLLADESRLKANEEALALHLRQADATLREAQRQVQAVGGDDAVARIEAERRNLLDVLEDGARTHLARRLGILVLTEGLRRYRDSHRSGMLTAASDAFARLTRGAYRSLAAQPADHGREVLAAPTASGATRLASQLSKGARAQLYLALRVAGYHELAKTRRPVPFLADDILETFDNARAAEAFRLLAGMARTGQVIYLTHHEHLCAIAQAECPELTVHHL